MNFPCQELPSNTLAAEQGIADLPCANGTEAVLSLASPATDFQLAEWRRRQNLVQAMFAAGVGEKRGASFAEVSRATGEPVANLCRYRQAWQRAEAAEPGTGWEALKPDIGTGRPAKFSLTRDEQLCLRGHNLTRGSLALAVEWFVRDARCTPATRALILAEQDRAARERTEARWPASLRRAGAVTVEERASFRGRKAMQDFESCDRRGLTWIDEQGGDQDLLPGTLFESDDMSSNEPCHFIDPETGIPRGGRQILFTGDVFSNAYIGATALGRERDAYRVEDIADHMLDVVQAHGMPLAWRLERGVWENGFVDGIAVEDITGKEDQRWGGLDGIFAIIHTWKSRGKGAIESSFNLLQNLIAHESTSIGRYRGEFENGTRLWLAAHRATALAEKHGTPESIAAAFKAWEPFWTMESMGDAYSRACEIFNTRPKKRRAHGREMVVPADQFRAAAAMRRDVPPDQLWRFCPVKRRATVRQGAIEMVVDHYPMPFRFRVNGATELYLEHGYSVLVAFHPGKPEDGCHIFNAELGTRNRDGYKFGEPLLVAQVAEDAPQFSLVRADQDALAMRRRAAAAVRSEFRAIMPAGRSAARVSVARDGRGNTATVATVATGNGIPPKEPCALRGGLRVAAGGAGHDYDAEAARLRTEDAERASHALPE